ncbi:unnamed protein product [Linum trigynum]|uniref:Integrase catalytic domain-containing protein n=1 Tax=Linum trigynum TaxID=586398 RepID=A0AAV2DSB2_9ROSI
MQFDCAKVINFCDEVGAIARFTSVAYPQANGQAEAANKSILHGLHTRLGEAKGKWAEELHTVLWAHRTTFKAATGETPFALTYCSDAVIPIETVIPTYRITMFNEEDNNEARLTDLELTTQSTTTPKWSHTTSKSETKCCGVTFAPTRNMGS